MQKKLNKIVNRTNSYLYNYFSKQKKSELIKQMFAENTPGADLKFPNPLPQIEVDCDYIEF